MRSLQYVTSNSPHDFTFTSELQSIKTLLTTLESKLHSFKLCNLNFFSGLQSIVTLLTTLESKLHSFKLCNFDSSVLWRVSIDCSSEVKVKSFLRCSTASKSAIIVEIASSYGFRSISVIFHIA
jgi:FAD synthase